MKSIRYLFLLMLLASCSSEYEINEEFGDAYLKILVTREMNQDTAIANPLVLSILDSAGYTEPEFREEFSKIVQNNPDAFNKLLDSLRRKAVSISDSLKREERSK